MAKKLTEDELIQRGKDLFSSGSLQRSDILTERWKSDNDLYDSKYPENENSQSNILKSQGKLFIPKTYSHTQRILADVILEALFFDQEEVVAVSAWKDVDSTTRDIVKTLLNYRLNSNPINFYNEAYEAVLDALKVKVGIMKVYPKVKKEKVDVEVPVEPVEVTVGEDGVPRVKTETKKEEQVTFFAPVIECIPYEDVFFSTDATWKDYYKFPIVHRKKVTLDYLKRRGYENLDQLQDSQGVGAGESITDEIKQQRTQGKGSPFSAQIKTDADKKFYLYEVWDFMKVGDDEFTESCSYIMVGDDGGPSILVRDVQKNNLPYRHEGEDYNRPPIVFGQALPEPHKLYGKSIPEIVEALQKETNSLRNQSRESTALAMRPPIMVNRSANIDLMGLVNRGIGRVVLGDDVSSASIRELAVSGPSGASIAEQQRTDQDFFETTSIAPNLLGAPSGEETASAATQQQQNANKKIALIVKNLDQTLFTPVFNMLLRLEQEFETDEFVAKVTGRKLGLQFEPDSPSPTEVIQGEFELKASTGLNKQVQLNKWMMLVERGNLTNQSMVQMVQLGVIPQDRAHFVDTMKMYHKMLAILGEKEFTEFMIQAQPPTPQAGGGGGAPGVASQPAMSGAPEAGVMNLNPEGFEG